MGNWDATGLALRCKEVVRILAAAEGDMLEATGAEIVPMGRVPTEEYPTESDTWGSLM